MSRLLRVAHFVLDAPRRLRDLVYCARLKGACTTGTGVILAPEATIRGAGRAASVVIGAHTLFMGDIVIIADGAVRIGEWCYIGPGARLWSSEAIAVGDRVLVSHGVHIFDNNSHSLSAAERHQRFEELRNVGRHLTPEAVARAPVTIGDDVWIGFNAAILKGVTVGRGAVIGAGAIVTRDVPPYAVMVGNPARQVGESRP